MSSSPLHVDFGVYCFPQEIIDKEETFRISSSSTLEEDHEARQESRHVMNMTPNGPRTEASTYKTLGSQREDGGKLDGKPHQLNREGNNVKDPQAGGCK
jgi:hypothetical protein